MTTSRLSVRSVRDLHAILRSPLEGGELGQGRPQRRAGREPAAGPAGRAGAADPGPGPPAAGGCQGRPLGGALHGDSGPRAPAGRALDSRWADDDMVSARLWSRHSLQPVHGQFQLVEPTTARSRRSLDMQQAGPAAYRARQLEERLAAGAAWQGRNLVVCGYFGQFLHGKWVPSTSKRFCNALGYRASAFMTSAISAHRSWPPRE